MLTNFQIFGIEHIIALLIPVVIGIIFIMLVKKYPNKRKQLSITLAILIILIRFVRYAFDIYLGDFAIEKLFSIHICNIDLIILIICLINPKEKLFVFTFLIGIPTALAVALFPGTTHPDPGMPRAIFFIMSHMMLVVGAIYLLITYKFKISFKDLKFYYIFSLIGMVIIYIFNSITNSNFMYLMEGPKDTILETLYNTLGPVIYIVSIYLILITLLTLLYFLYKLVKPKTVEKIKET